MACNIKGRKGDSVKTEFSSSWKSSKQPRKQRKYRFNAPQHIKRKFLGSHLSRELRKKTGRRSLPVRKGDTVTVTKGEFRKKSGKVERVDIKNSRAYITGIETKKKDGTKAFIPVKANNLIITELTEDRKRMAK